MEVEHTPIGNTISFQVDDVVICKDDPSYLRSAKDVLQYGLRIKEELEDFSHRENREECFIGSSKAGFLEALQTAFRKHYPLKLSVSDFLILIAQGLSIHINKYAEELRQYFVNHSGKEKIEIYRGNFVKGQQNDWSTIFEEFGNEIKKKVKTDIYDVIVDDTSVATPTSRIASEITLMDSMKSYFDYVVMTECGFPLITLEGTPDDWKKLREKYKRLTQMNKDDCMKLDFWLKHLTPIIEKICETGITQQPDVSFWKNMYKYRGSAGSGGKPITG